MYTFPMIISISPLIFLIRENIFVNSKLKNFFGLNPFLMKRNVCVFVKNFVYFQTRHLYVDFIFFQSFSFEKKKRKFMKELFLITDSFIAEKRTYININDKNKINYVDN